MSLEKHPRGPLDRVANPLVGFDQVMGNFVAQAGRVFGFDRLWVLQVGADGAVETGRHWGAGPAELLPDLAGPLAAFHRAHRRLPATPVTAGPDDPELGEIARRAGGGGSVLLVPLRLRGAHRFLYADLGIAADLRLLVVVGGLPNPGLAPDLAAALTLCAQQSFNLAYVGTGLLWTGNLATGLFQLSPYGMVRKNPGPGYVFNLRAGLIAGLPAGGSGSVRRFEDLFPEAEEAGLAALIAAVERRERDGGELEFAHAVDGETHLVRAKVTYLDLGPDEEEWAGARTEEQGNYWVVVGLEDITERVRRQRLDRELELAQSVQAQLMPEHLPRLAGIDLAVHSASASEMNGDFLDLIQQPDGSLVIAVGDVSGHGIPAGIVMGLAKSALHTALLAEPEPGRIMQLMNTVLVRLATRRRFVTLVLARLEPGSGRLSLASAGHPPALVHSARTGRTRFMELVALPLGLRPELEFPRAETCLEPSDLVVFYSDGIVEALDERERVFGYERLRRLVRRVADGSAAEVRGAVAAALERYRGERPRDDDQTLVVVKMRDESEGAPAAGVAGEVSARSR